MTEQDQPNIIAPRWIVGAVIATLVAIAALGNVFGTVYCCTLNDSQTAELIDYSAAGLLIAQVCLLAVWCALGNQPWLVRIPLTMGILFGLFCVYIKTITIMDIFIISDEVFLMVLAVTILMLCLLLPLFIIRRVKGTVIQIPVPTSSVTTKNQFSIKHLLILTTIVAILIPVVRVTFPAINFKDGLGDLDTVLIGFLVLLSLLTTLATLFFMRIALSSSHRGFTGVLLILTVLLGPLIVCGTVELVDGGPFISYAYLNTVAFTGTLALTVTAVLFLFYDMGYRLQSNSR